MTTWDGSSLGVTKIEIEEAVEAQVKELLERARVAEGKINAIYAALDAAERSCHRSGSSLVGGTHETQCDCASCVVIRGIRAFIKETK